jgi:hypothetical protein
MGCSLHDSRDGSWPLPLLLPPSAPPPPAARALKTITPPPGEPGEATTAGGPSGDPNSAGSQGGSAASACRRPNARSRSTKSRASCVWTSHRQSSPPIGPIRSAIARPTRRRCSPPHRNRPPAPQGPRQSLGLIRRQPPFRHPLAQPRQQGLQQGAVALPIAPGPRGSTALTSSSPLIIRPIRAAAAPPGWPRRSSWGSTRAPPAANGAPVRMRMGGPHQ